MPALADLQTEFRRAVAHPGAEVPAQLTAPVAAAARLTIYRRHYRDALVRHLAGRFPTVEWLIGTRSFIDTAGEHVRRSPPGTPCMAEYGQSFIDALAGHAVPYAADAARLDWALGTVAVAIDAPAIGIGDLGAWPAERLPDLGLSLQPGLAYLDLAWPVDDLVRIRLEDRDSRDLPSAPAAMRIEVRGARGQFQMRRLAPAAWAFRSSLEAGGTLGEAIEAALAVDACFDVSAGLAALFSEGLVVGVRPAGEG